jgi:hypothetical protein
MTKLQSSLDVAVEILRELEEFDRSGSKEAFRKQVREDFVRRSGEVPASGSIAMTLHQLTYVPSLSDCISVIRCRSGMGNGKRWLRLYGSSICVVASAVVAPSLSALDLEKALVVVGA